MRLYIYGAGRIGRPLEELLVEKGYVIEGFIDVNAANKRYKNYKIITPDQIDKEEDIAIIVALEKENVANSVKESLESAGCPHVLLYSDSRIQNILCPRKFSGWNVHNVYLSQFVGRLPVPRRRVNCIWIVYQ